MKLDMIDFFKTYNFDDKKRYGSINDGGYVIGELPKDSYDCYISAGVSNEESFTKDFLNNYEIDEFSRYAFDGTIKNYPYEYTTNIAFTRKNIGVENNNEFTNLKNILSKYKNIFLKMDIEGGEYPWINQLDISYLKNIKQITIEFHGILDNTWGSSFSDKKKCFELLCETHYLIHFHGNNYSGCYVDTIHPVPSVVECTYIRKDFFDVSPELNKRELPTDGLDFRNHPHREDFDLNFYPFVNKEKVDKNLLIPRIIHQTSGFKKGELPKEIVDNINRLKEMNPTFEYRYYDNDDCIKFIKSNYDKKTLKLYLSINPKFGPARADLFRYLLMYKVGGVYLDIKSYTIRPLDEILLPSDEYLLSHWIGKDWDSLLEYEHGEFQNWHIICVPNHPFLKKTIENVMYNISNYNPDKLSTIDGVVPLWARFEIEKSRVILTTGPIPYSISILSMIKNYNLDSKDCPIREFESSGESFGISYSFLPFIAGKGEHHNLYTGYPKGEDLIIKK